jgi:hypothetical protein
MISTDSIRPPAMPSSFPLLICFLLPAAVPAHALTVEEGSSPGQTGYFSAAAIAGGKPAIACRHPRPCQKGKSSLIKVNQTKNSLKPMHSARKGAGLFSSISLHIFCKTSPDRADTIPSVIPHDANPGTAPTQ